MTCVWIVLILPGVTLWRDSVPFLVAVSIYANVMGHGSSWQSSRVEVKQDEQAPDPQRIKMRCRATPTVMPRRLRLAVGATPPRTSCGR